MLNFERKSKSHRLLPGMLVMLLYQGVGLGAEIRGQVQIASLGASLHETLPANLPVGVSLEPLQGQSVAERAPRGYHVVIAHNKMNPLFLTIRRGDNITFENKDKVYHQIYSKFGLQPFTFQLSKRGSGNSVHTVRFDYTGVWHLFCGIHNRMYARVDVVDTPYIQNVSGSGAFSFTNLVPGKWRVRVATVGGPVVETETEAFTAPPPLRISVPVNRGLPANQNSSRYQPSAIEALFPDR
jgi:plastocyanin